MLKFFSKSELILVFSKLFGFQFTLLNSVSCCYKTLLVFNLFHATDLFINPLKSSKKQRFSNVFRGYRKRLVWNDLNIWRFFFISAIYWFSLQNLCVKCLFLFTIIRKSAGNSSEHMLTSIKYKMAASSIELERHSSRTLLYITEIPGIFINEIAAYLLVSFFIF